MTDKPAATGSREPKGGDRSLCATCGVLIIFGGTDSLYRHKHWVHVERENEDDEREYTNCSVPDNPHYLVATPTPPASQPTVTLDRETVRETIAVLTHILPLIDVASWRDAKSRVEGLLALLRAAEQK